MGKTLEGTIWAQEFTRSDLPLQISIRKERLRSLGKNNTFGRDGLLRNASSHGERADSNPAGTATNNCPPFIWRGPPPHSQTYSAPWGTPFGGTGTATNNCPPFIWRVPPPHSQTYSAPWGTPFGGTGTAKEKQGVTVETVAPYFCLTGRAYHSAYRQATSRAADPPSNGPRGVGPPRRFLLPSITSPFLMALSPPYRRP